MNQTPSTSPTFPASGSKSFSLTNLLRNPNAFFILCMVLMSIFITVGFFDKRFLKDRTITVFYTMIILIPMVMGMYTILNNSFELNRQKSGFLKRPEMLYAMVGFIVFFAAVWVGRQYGFGILSNQAMFYLFLAGAVVGAALFIRMYIDDIRKYDGFTGFIINSVFYVPCLLNDLLDSAREQYSGMPHPVLVLLITEILIISAIFIVPRVHFSHLITKEGTPLYPGILSLNKRKDNITHKSIPTKPIHLFAFSFWVFLNPIESTTDELEFFTATFSTGNNKVKLLFNLVENTYRLDMNVGSNEVQLDFPEPIQWQRWNFFVLNFDNTKLDIFCNGKVAVSADFNSSDLGKFENISTGNNSSIMIQNNSLMANLRFYNAPLKTYEINTMYNVLKSQRTPVQTSAVLSIT